MKLKDVKERLEVHHADLSGSSFDDVNFSGASYRNIVSIRGRPRGCGVRA